VAGLPPTRNQQLGATLETNHNDANASCLPCVNLETEVDCLALDTCRNSTDFHLPHVSPNGDKRRGRTYLRRQKKAHRLTFSTTVSGVNGV